MLKRSTSLLPIFLVLLTAAAWPPPVQAAASVSFGAFYDSLAPYGVWNDHPRYGWVWAPHVSAGWRPYSFGDWYFVEDHGWTWFGDEPWAWAPYHYGRWDFDPVLGWIWIPGYEWGPGWVDWVATDGWIGWAPLRPRPVWTTWFVGPRISADRYCFVERRFFGGQALRRHIVPARRNPDLFRVARRVRSVDVAPIVHASGRRIQPLRLREVSSPRAARVSFDSGEARLFRPHIDRRAKARWLDRERTVSPRSSSRSLGTAKSRLSGREDRSFDRQLRVRPQSRDLARTIERRPDIRKPPSRDLHAGRSELRKEHSRARVRAPARSIERRLDARRAAPRRLRPVDTGRHEVRSLTRERSSPTARFDRGQARETRMARQPQRMRQHSPRAPQPPRRQGRGRG